MTIPLCQYTDLVMSCTYSGEDCFLEEMNTTFCEYCNCHNNEKTTETFKDVTADEISTITYTTLELTDTTTTTTTAISFTTTSSPDFSLNYSDRMYWCNLGPLLCFGKK